jgi:hypothetical protein
MELDSGQCLSDFFQEDAKAKKCSDYHTHCRESSDGI